MLIWKQWSIGFGGLVILSLIFGGFANAERPRGSNHTTPGVSLSLSATSEITNAWQLNGNAETDPLTNFLGTTDHTSLEVRVNNQHALRIEPSSEAQLGHGANLIGGFRGNEAAETAGGGAIGGGGQPGFPNRVVGDLGTIGGGSGNQVAELATIGGGFNNTSSGYRAVIAGGSNNLASSGNTTIGGGNRNTASSTLATVGGGSFNTADALSATVGGGSGNLANGRQAVVGGGARNIANGFEATVSGGALNVAGSAFTTVSGGQSNLASGRWAAVGGGAGNVATSENSTIGGGLSNQATDRYSTVGGGRANVAGNMNDDTADARYATVGGGQDNTASGQGATVGGGLENEASGKFATVSGGFTNEASGDYSFAAGHRAKIDADHAGAFLYADSSDVDFDSATANEFAVRATGGVRLVTAVDPTGAAAAGVRLAEGSSSWQSLSDRNAKTNVESVDKREVLARLMTVPISTWNYETQTPAIRHIGPMAQDFYKAFKVGEDDRYINTVDADGVSLAAIQGLYQLVQEQQTQIAAQQKQIAALENRLTVLERTVVENTTFPKISTMLVSEADERLDH